MDALPIALYTAEQSRRLDRRAVECLGIPEGELMERAGRAAFESLRRHWPGASRIVVVAGPGNNGGDGLVVARLARAAGLPVRVLCPGARPARGDAAGALARFEAAGGRLEDFMAERLDGADLIVDAVFGSGLGRPVEGPWRVAIEACAGHRAPVFALDVPSGVDSDTGQVLGVAVPAARTLCFITLKQGLLTGQAPGHVGRLDYASLDLPSAVFAGEPPSAERFPDGARRRLLTRRPRHAHKGMFGHVVVVGGAPGMLGAVRLAAGAALRSGAGLVTVATHPVHAALLDGLLPEAMCHAVADGGDLAPLLERATVVVIGPGLGRGAWGADLLETVRAWTGPRVVDADGLNGLAQTPTRDEDWILTPHPGEAARLLGTTVAAVQADRYAAVRALRERYGGIALLKGAGTLVDTGAGPVRVVCGGNPGMASGGMGDVLTGVVAGLRAQGFAAGEAACLAVAVHARAGDLASGEAGERGLLASDLLGRLRQAVNPR